MELFRSLSIDTLTKKPDGSIDAFGGVTNSLVHENSVRYWFADVSLYRIPMVHSYTFFLGHSPKKRCNQDFCIDNYTTMSYNFAHEKVIDKMVQKMV